VTPEPLSFVDLAAQQRAIRPALDEAMARVLAHGQYVLGPEVGELESALAARAGVSHVVSCASGSDALLMVLLAHEVGPGDAVLVPAFTFAATAGAVALTGATPVFVDVIEATMNLDPDAIAPAVSVARGRGLAPRGIIPVDLYGQPADHDEIAKQADAEDLWVLADAAQSFGASYRDRPVGSLASATATSFFPSKPLGAYGDGGAVLTDEPDLAELLVSLREHGRGSHRYDIQRVGLNGRLDTLQAAVLLQKLTVFDRELSARRAAATHYEEGLRGVVSTPSLGVARTSTWAQYTVRAPDREALVACLAEQGVPTAIHYPVPLHRQPAYAAVGLAGGPMDVAETLSADVLSLPMHPYLTEADQDRVIDAVRRAVSP
jgi:dTDP-4-amino-4,6-dideoxygalactose transaminase